MTHVSCIMHRWESCLMTTIATTAWVPDCPVGRRTRAPCRKLSACCVGISCRCTNMLECNTCIHGNHASSSFKYRSVCPGLTWCGTPVCASYYSAVVYDTCVLHHASMGIMLDDYNHNNSVDIHIHLHRLPVHTYTSTRTCTHIDDLTV